MITLVLVYLLIGSILSTCFFGNIVAIYLRVFKGKSFLEAVEAIDKKEVIYSIFLWPATVQRIPLWQAYFEREEEECIRLAKEFQK